MKISIEIVSHELIGLGRRQGLMPRFLKDKKSSQMIQEWDSGFYLHLLSLISQTKRISSHRYQFGLKFDLLCSDLQPYSSVSSSKEFSS